MTSRTAGRLSIGVALVTMCLRAAPAAAQAEVQPLFAEQRIGPAISESIRLDLLFDAGTDRVRLNVGGHEWIARLERIDRNVLGHRAWVGVIEGIPSSHVSVAERNGIVSGLINAVGERYEIRTVAPGSYALARVEDREREESDPLIPAVHSGRASAPARAAAALDSPDGIDVLLLYTAAARERVGGLAQMQALVARIVSDSNTTFQRSGVPARLRLAGAIEAPITESTDFAAVLQQVTDHATVRAAREFFHADLVQLLVSSPTATSCGVAWLLTTLDDPDFNAYSVADVDCSSQYTPIHEMAHNMGSHHAPEDGASFALFPYSFAYKDPGRGFRTVMAYSCAGTNCPRVPAFSDPSLVVDGGSSGTPLQNNAQSLRNAVATVANFRRAAQAVAPPAAPGAPTSQVNAQTVTLSWNPASLDVSGAPTITEGYAIGLRATSGNFPQAYVPVGPTTAVSGALPLGTYAWRVFAYNAAGTGPGSEEQSFTVGPACATPGPPENLHYTLRGNVSLLWTPASSGAPPTRYIVEVGSSSGLADLYVTSVTGIALDTAAPPGAYFVRVRAANQCGVSAASTEKIVVVP